MKNISISDITLRKNSGEHTALSFNEKLEVAKQLDKIRVDVIETAPIKGGKTDVLFLHTVASLVTNSILACPTGLTEESVEQAYDAIKGAVKPRLVVSVPVSTVQMEYVCKMKPAKVLELVEKLVTKAKSLCDDVEVSFADATRAEAQFLGTIIEKAVECGAKTVNLCDDAGAMLPDELEAYVKNILETVNIPDGIAISVECSDRLHMAVAEAICAVEAGAAQIKTVVGGDGVSLGSFAQILREKADNLGIATGVDMTRVENAVSKLSFLGDNKAAFQNSPFDNGTGVNPFAGIMVRAEDDIKTVCETVNKMGYELSGEDMKNVYAEIKKAAEKAKKPVSAKEIDSIIATVAMQVAPTYKLVSYVINSGDIITPTANVELTKNGETFRGFCVGDGPIGAAFLAIEQITGHHYELDEFRIRSVTGGSEAMGSALVKLRHNGKLFSGSGVSTDIVGAGINAYINALNKICFEEDVK